MNIIYINLDKRTDRKKHIESLFPNAVRFPAIVDDRGGYFGCVRSHIECLKLAKENNYDKVIILEDDFIYKDSRTLESMILPDKFNMLLLSNLVVADDIEPYNMYFDRVFKAQWTSGYCVDASFYDTLIKTFEESLNQLSKNYCRDNYLDIYWNKIFKTNLVLKHKKIIGGQLPNNYSDIKNKIFNRKN